MFSFKLVAITFCITVAITMMETQAYQYESDQIQSQHHDQASSNSGNSEPPSPYQQEGYQSQTDSGNNQWSTLKGTEDGLKSEDEVSMKTPAVDENRHHQHRGDLRQRRHIHIDLAGYDHDHHHHHPNFYGLGLLGHLHHHHNPHFEHMALLEDYFHHHHHHHHDGHHHH